MSVEAKAFDEPDDRVTFEHGHVDLVTVGSLTIGREVLEPGWRWSTHVKPIVNTDWCEFHHVTFLLAGRVRIVTRDGEIRDISPGVVFDVAPGHDAWVLGDEPAVSIDFQGVVGWAKAPEPGERVLTTVLITDIVGSTATAERLGDGAWKRLLPSHQEDVRTLLDLHRGRLVNTTGDGFVSTFDAPGRAINCALALVAAAAKLGIQIRAGVHSGEVELADGDLRGLAVHLAARIMDAAESGSVFVSGTARELTSGASIDHIDKGSADVQGDQRTAPSLRGSAACDQRLTNPDAFTATRLSGSERERRRAPVPDAERTRAICSRRFFCCPACCAMRRDSWGS